MSPLEDIENLAQLQGLRVAICHYWLVTWRGGEKVLASMLKLFPNADIYTLFYSPSVCGPHLVGHQVYSSVLDRPGVRQYYQKLFPLYPMGIKSLVLQKDYDLLISSESGPAKGIANPKKVPHLCYIHTPMRYCWVDRQSYLERVPKRLRGLADREFERLKKWDLKTASAPDRYVANSQNVAERVRRFYHREASVCCPPIALDLFEGPLGWNPEGFYLSFGGLTPYKNIDLLVEPFTRSGESLKIIGDGPERPRLEALAGPNIQFLGSLETSQLAQEIAGAKALLFPGDEDFGMIPLEVMARGIPVIALGKGGALETVVENKARPESSSGVFFAQPTLDDLSQALAQFEAQKHRFDPDWIRAHARNFGEDRFLTCFGNEVTSLLNR